MTSLLTIQASRSGERGRAGRRRSASSSSRWTRSANGFVAAAISSGKSWCRRQCSEVMNRAPSTPGSADQRRERVGDVEVQPVDGVVEVAPPARPAPRSARRSCPRSTARRSLVLAAEVPVEGLQRDVGLLDELLRRELLAALDHEPVGGGEQRLGCWPARVRRSGGARASSSARRRPRSSTSRSASRRRQHDDGDLAVGARLVHVVVRPHLGDDLPEARLLVGATRCGPSTSDAVAFTWISAARVRA